MEDDLLWRPSDAFVLRSVNCLSPLNANGKKNVAEADRPVSEMLQKPGESRKDELIPPPNEESHPLVMEFGQGAGVIMCLRQ